MEIDWGPILIAILGIVGLFFGGWKARVAEKAIADRKQAEAEAEETKANAARINADAETQSTMTRLTERQQTLLEGMQKSNQQFKRATVTQLRRISGLFSDIRNGETNIHNSLTQLLTAQQQLITTMSGIPQAVAQAVVQGIAEGNRVESQALGKTLRGVSVDGQALDRYEREGYRFPAAEDPDWLDEMIYPIVPDVFVHKGPYYDSELQLRKPCAQIRPEGEQVRLIEKRYPDWVIVDKIEDGMRCWGYVSRQKIRIGTTSGREPIHHSTEHNL